MLVDYEDGSASVGRTRLNAKHSHELLLSESAEDSTTNSDLSKPLLLLAAALLMVVIVGASLAFCFLRQKRTYGQCSRTEDS